MMQPSYGQHCRYRILLFALAATLGAPNTMAFPFGNLMGVMDGGNAASPANEPDTFIQSVKASENLMDKSTTILVRCLADRESVATMNAEKSHANAVTDPAERLTRLTELKKNKRSVLYEALSNDRLKAEIQKMDVQEKEVLGAAAFNFALSQLQGKALMKQAETLISHMSSKPATQPKMDNVKEAALSISNQVFSTALISDKMSRIFSAVGMSGPVSKDEAPRISGARSGVAEPGQPPEGPPNTPY